MFDVEIIKGVIAKAVIPFIVQKKKWETNIYILNIQIIYKMY